MFEIRPLTSLADCARVVELEKEIWSYTSFEDVVPSSVLIVTVKRGGILLGAFDEGGAMIGFVYSIPGWKGRQPIQWSYMLGVTSGARDGGVATALKFAQRRHALTQRIELVEWTYDPLQTVNAYFNFRKLGIIATEYEENVYGESSSPLHQGTPTDRFVAEWHLGSPRVEELVRSAADRRIPETPLSSATLVNPSIEGTRWLTPGRADLLLTAAEIRVEIPMGFSEMQARDSRLALEWRTATRAIFRAYFERGYRATDFFLLRERRRGQYLLTRPGP
jgi:predicted GNAT superfamily acetyltransferase